MPSEIKTETATLKTKSEKYLTMSVADTINFLNKSCCDDKTIEDCTLLEDKDEDNK